MTDNLEPRKSLWKNLKTEKKKESLAQQVRRSVVVEANKDSFHFSQPNRGISHMKESKDSGVIKQKANQQATRKESQDSRMKQNVQSDKYQMCTLLPLGTTETGGDSNSRNRRLSIGEESVVEEIVDFKHFHNLDFADFEQDQQPMIMSLGSQSNPAIKHIKLGNVKEQIYKLELGRLNLLKFIQQQQKDYQEFFLKNFQNLIAFIIDFYADQLERKQTQHQNSEKIKLSNQNKKILADEETPRFPKKMDQEAKQSFNFKQSLLVKEQIQKLQQSLQRTSTENKKLEALVSELRLVNDELNQVIFDYEQKSSQFELEVSRKVGELVAQKMKDTKSREQQEADRKYYLDQIISLEREIQMLERKSFSQEALIREELEEKEQELLYKQSQLKQKQKALNELHVRLNSEKMEMDKKIMAIQKAQNQQRTLQAVLQKKEYDIVLRQKQIYSKQSQLQNRPVETNREDSAYYGSFNIGAESLGQKLKHLSDLKPLRSKYKQQMSKNGIISSQASMNWKLQNMTDYSIKLRPAEAMRDQPQRNSKSKQRYVLSKTFYVTNKNESMSPRNQTNVNLFAARSSGIRQGDKNRLDLGAKLENLRNQIRKEIRDAE